MLTRNVKRILVGLAVILALVLAIVALSKIGKLEKTKDLGLTAFEIGTLNEAKGSEE